MKPCPFCGGEAVIHCWIFGAQAICKKCRAKGPEAIDWKGRKRSFRARAIALWDSRPPITKATPEDLFRIVHGRGDAGSAREFRMTNPAVQKGWERLARRFNA